MALSLWAASSSKHGGLQLTCCRTPTLLLRRTSSRNLSFVSSKQRTRHVRPSILIELSPIAPASRSFFSFTKSSKPTPPAEPTSPDSTTNPSDSTPASGIQNKHEDALPDIAEQAASMTASTTAPPAEVLPTDATTEAVGFSTTLLPSPPPLELGDFAAMGLAGYTPAGIIRWSFELINVATGMPWFWTIIAGTVMWRLAVTPFVVQNLQNTAKLMPLQPRLAELREDMKRAQAQGDRLALQRVALKQKKLYNDAGVSMGKMLITPFIQLPVTLGLFFGVKTMCNFPVEQLKTSGIDLIPDLTVADPFNALPWIVLAVVNLQILVGAREANLKERPEMGHIFNGLRILTLAGVYVMYDFPSGLMISLLATSGATTLQSLLFQIPAVRNMLGIPIVPPEHRGKLPSYKETAQFIKDYFKKKAAAERQKQLTRFNQKRQ